MNGKAHSVGTRGPDEGCSAHKHVLDRVGRIRERREPHCLEKMRELGLVDDDDRPAILRKPDRAIRNVVYLHITTIAECRPGLNRALGFYSVPPARFIGVVGVRI